MTVSDFKSDMHFSIFYALLRVISDYSTRFKLTAIADWAHKKREVWITNYLESSLSNVIDKYKKIDNVGEYVDNAPIWVCWWTGMETAPKLVKQCIKSIYKNANDYDKQIYMEKKLFKWSNAKISANHNGIGKSQIYRIVEKIEDRKVGEKRGK